ncbi:hypothetical protein AK830_g11168 [Neonectria ditissima]|uniref:Uncharacterized protein n=1 Tax=Neonectria ditissima TaxID=78410 RepID=A0A0P7B3X9_9HYPO|nr:hypothetical protein AK830_g11168 [Neonectria ditissima]
MDQPPYQQPYGQPHLPQHPATAADWRPTRDFSGTPTPSSQPRDASPPPPISPETPYTAHRPPPQFAFTEQPPQPPQPGFFASRHSPQPPQPGFFGYAPQHAYAPLEPETPQHSAYYPPGSSSPGYFARPPADQSSPAPWETFAQPTPSPGFLGSHTRHDSAADLLNPAQEDGARGSPLQGHSQTRQWQQKQRNAFFGFVDWWFSFWSQAWSMCCFLVAGILFAAGHHAFYEGLDGKEAENQPRMLRYGTALAFLAKANLVCAVGLAFRQRAWMMVRRKILSVGAVDSLFAAAEDLSAFLNWETIKSAKLAMCLAVYIWATPLIVILTSETLSVTPQTKREHTHCPSIRTLNFTHEEVNDWRKPISIENLYGLSLSLWNTTADGEPDPNDPNSFDYWTASSQQSRQVALRTAYLQQAIMRKDAPEEICSVGWNCSFTIQFTGPGYKCEELASGVRSEVKQLGNSVAPFTTSDLLPFGNFSYLAVTDQGDYAAQQMDSAHGGKPKQAPPYPKSLGAFRTEPIIWIGYADVDDRTKRQPQNRSVDGWYDAYTPTIFGCEHYETKYAVEFNYTGGIQAHRIKKREFLSRVVDTRYIPGQSGADGTLDNTTALPEANFVYPQDVANYRRIGAYHSLGKLMRTILNGTIAMPYSISETQVTETRLIERVNYLPVTKFHREVEAFYEEMLLSLLSNPQFLAVSWASDPSKPSGVAAGGASTRYPCTRERTTNTFVYHRLELWIVYSIAIVMALAGVVSGLTALREEGVFRDNRFSSVVAATRGPSLNKVRWGGGERSTRDLRVGFGVVTGYAGEREPGFGLEGDVSQDRDPRMARSPAIQMMEWGEKATKRVKTATMRAH